MDSVLQSLFALLDTLTTLPLPSLGPTALLALAPLHTIPLRTALTGTASYLDTLLLAPGLHLQSTAPDLNKGEYPACAAMTTGYVFRVENPATVLFLQRVGKTGCLTTLTVEPGCSAGAKWEVLVGSWVTIAGFAVLLGVRDFVSMAVIEMLVIARLVNIFVIQRRAKPGWFGASEPGVESDLLVLLSQDRWIRIQGLTDDVKAVTSGTWLRDASFFEDSLVSCAKLVVYLAAALSINSTPIGSLLILLILVSNAAILGLANHFTRTLTMFNRTISIKHPPKQYPRRLDLTKDLVQEFHRTDCFVAMGMIQPDKENEFAESYKGAVVT